MGYRATIVALLVIKLALPWRVTLLRLWMDLRHNFAIMIVYQRKKINKIDLRLPPDTSNESDVIV